jgi:hypothetical protein
MLIQFTQFLGFSLCCIGADRPVPISGDKLETHGVYSRIRHLICSLRLKSRRPARSTPAAGLAPVITGVVWVLLQAEPGKAQPV